MRRLGTTLALALALGIAAWPTRIAAELVASLSDHLVAITTSFAGADVLLFGTTGGRGDVVVVVRGPESEQTVRRKGRKFGVWLNDAEVTFGDVPGYYAIAANRPVDEFLPEPTSRRYQIGLDNLRLPIVRGSGSSGAESFRAALFRNKQRTGLYPLNTAPILFLGERLFRTDMRVPANAPVGDYTVSIYLVEDGEITQAESTPLIVSKVGLEARLFDFAHRQSAAYGILAVIIAAVAGWLAHIIFRKS